MAQDSPPVGQLFSHVYLERGTPLKDGELFRRRLAAYFDSFGHEDDGRIRRYIKEETGLTVDRFPEAFFVRTPLPLLLNIITLIWRDLAVRHGSQDGRGGWITERANDWHQFVSRVFREENMGYTLDVKAGVHFLVDEEFERNRVSVLRCLGAPRYAGVRAAFEDAHRHLDATPPDTKASVRSVFESIEILAKLMVETKNLNQWLVENKLKPIAESVYTGDKTAVESIGAVFDGFALWVDGLHLYRHGQATPEPVAPPLEFAIYVLSSGASFLRWLVDIDTRLQSSGGKA